MTRLSRNLESGKEQADLRAMKDKHVQLVGIWTADFVGLHNDTDELFQVHKPVASLLLADAKGGPTAPHE